MATAAPSPPKPRTATVTRFATVRTLEAVWLVSSSCAIVASMRRARSFTASKICETPAFCWFTAAEI